jgi:hypothetical protein
MAWAIFWLPLVAGILLGGLAVGSWYGGDKTVAVWVGFVGVICLVLTATLQVQQYVWRVANQPQLTLVSGEQPTFLRWDPPNSYQMQVNDIPNPNYGAWKVPTLHVHNTGAFAQDATFKWGVTPYEVKALVESSPRFNDQTVLVEPNQVTLGPKSGGSGISFSHPLQWTISVPLPFITRDTAVFIRMLAFRCSSRHARL